MLHPYSRMNLRIIVAFMDDSRKPFKHWKTYFDIYTLNGLKLFQRIWAADQISSQSGPCPGFTVSATNHFLCSSPSRTATWQTLVCNVSLYESLFSIIAVFPSGRIKVWQNANKQCVVTHWAAPASIKTSILQPFSPLFPHFSHSSDRHRHKAETMVLTQQLFATAERVCKTTASN